MTAPIPEQPDQRDPLIPAKAKPSPSLSLLHLVSLPFEILSSIFSYFNLSPSLSSTNIVKITPRNPTTLDNGETLNQWIAENVPRLRGSFNPTRLLPKCVRLYSCSWG